MTTQKQAIPTTVLAGFLGSGKTTLVNHLLRNAGGRRILVLVNDFGSISIDTDLIESEDGTTLTLANGCACCSMGADLYEAFNQVIDFSPPPDQLIIEASGVAEPRRIANFAKAEPDLSLNAIVTLIDGVNFKSSYEDPRLADVMVEQVRAANMLFINKQDMLNGQQRADLNSILTELNSSALQMETINSAVSPDLIFADFWREKIPEIDEHSHVHGDMFESWSCSTELSFSGEALKNKLSTANSDLYRFKGIFKNTDNGDTLWSIHKVGTLIDLQPLKKSNASEAVGSFVAIGPKGTGFNKELDQFFK